MKALTPASASSPAIRIKRVDALLHRVADENQRADLGAAALRSSAWASTLRNCVVPPRTEMRLISSASPCPPETNREARHSLMPRK